MKRLFVAILTLLILYSIYYDLTSGSLPPKETKNVAVPVTNMNKENDFFEVTVKPGETVLSIMEQSHTCFFPDSCKGGKSLIQ
jgi:hypothetical protein